MGSTERTRLLAYYNGNNYDASTNPGGMAKGGHRTNLVPAFQDISVVGQDCADAASAAQASESQTGAWKDETAISAGVVTRVDARTVRISGGGDRTGIYTEGRAVKLTQSANAYGYVVSSSYSSPHTNVIVSCIVDSGLSAMSFGQDPLNAPQVSSDGSDLYICDNYYTLGGF